MVDKITSELPGASTHLYDAGRDEHYQIHYKTIEDLIFAICEKERSVQFGRKASHLESRFLDQDHHHKTSAAKAAHMRQVGTIAIGLVGAIVQVAAAQFGPNTPQNLGLTAAGKAIGTGGDHYGQRMNAKITELDHRYADTSTRLSSHTQGAHDANQSLDSIASVMSRLMQGRETVDRAILAGS